ncbi:DUF1501 domain-containing protein [Luteolibacter sp. SL250]|uniref:DUF1501 domain-containing protein n=1 Tax=Luteolibacter sp. SL250 TaxID=2995170 RepID=UPI00226E6EB6|nr:DUF1501 domain-containing protein [Luteolibacter sp. SL250]WAC18636.1 DUF1501 domain-containing protein [Luteolibacter sp. SL250]
MKDTPPHPGRRQFIGQAACAGLGLTGVMSTLGTLRLFNASLQAQGIPPTLDDHKSLICLFLYGGNDANNLLVPRDTTAYAAYQRDRGVLALNRDDLLPLSIPNDDGRQFGLHPAMGALHSVFSEQKMAMVCNVGTLVGPITKAEYLSGGAAIPPYLFSHNDQQMQWQTSVPDSPRTVGWGGRLQDLLHAGNGDSQISMNVSIAGSNYFQVGEKFSQYHVTPGGSIGLANYRDDWSPRKEMYQSFDQMIARSYGHIFEQEHSKIVRRAISNDTLLKTALAANPLPAEDAAFPLSQTEEEGAVTYLAAQLRMILRMIHARQALGMKRQIFFAAIGGFDTHDAQLPDHHALLKELSDGIADFYNATKTLGISDNVTLYTASDFNRTYNSNGKGSDHAWGSHQMIVGGAVNGGRLYGHIPLLEIDGPDDTGSRGSWIPKVSTDEMAATLALWFGVPVGDLPQVLPNIGRFANPDMGFMNLA